MHKRINGRASIIEIAKSPVLLRQRVAKIHDCPASIGSRVWPLHSVMQVHFDFTPAGVAVFCQLRNQTCIVLLRGIEIRMFESVSVVVRPAVYELWILFAPCLESFSLFSIGGASISVSGHD